MYPTSIDTFLNPQGSDQVSTGHAQDHRELGSVSTAIQSTLGTTAGTSVLKDFSAGQFPARINSSNVLQHNLQGTFNNSLFGTPVVTGGTLNNTTIGTPLVTGGTYNSGVFGTPSITGGTYNSGVFGTPSMTGGTLQSVKKLTPLVGTLVDAVGTITIDMNTAPVHELTLGTAAGNRTLASPSNPADGQLLTLRVKQNAGATGTLVFNSVFRHSSDVGTPSLGTASTWNYFAWRYSATDSKFDFQGQSKNII